MKIINKNRKLFFIIKKNIAVEPLAIISVITLWIQLPVKTAITKSGDFKTYSTKMRKRKSNELIITMYIADKQHAWTILHLCNSIIISVAITIRTDTVQISNYYCFKNAGRQ